MEDYQDDNNQEDYQDDTEEQYNRPSATDRLPSAVTAINQTLDESRISDGGNENTEGLLAYAAKKQKKKDTNKTEKLSSGNLIKTDKRNQDSSARFKSTSDKDENQLEFEPTMQQNILGKDQSFGSKEGLKLMTAQQLEVLSVQVNSDRFYLNKIQTGFGFLVLVLISISGRMQKSVLTNMQMFAHPDHIPKNGTYNMAEDKFYSIKTELAFTPEQWRNLKGDPYTIIYAFMILVLGPMSDLMSRKKMLLGSCFGWTVCTYFSSFITNYEQLLFLRLVGGMFSAISSPLSFGLLTDLIPRTSRTLAFSLFAFGMQLGGPIATFNVDFIEWLGWRATYQFLALQGFVILALSILFFDEPERGRFDIAHSVLNNPNQSQESVSIGYRLSDESTKKRLIIDQVEPEPEQSKFWAKVKQYFCGFWELLVNDKANLLLFAFLLRSLQGTAMSKYTGSHFKVYEGKDKAVSTFRTVAGLIGSFVCTMGTGMICDKYERYNYMTKSYICVCTALVSIPCSCMIYLCTTNFWVSIFGLFTEYLLSSGWRQPAIAMLVMVVDSSVRGTAISVLFFSLTIFGVLTPDAFNAIKKYYDVDPTKDPVQFGQFVCLCTVIPCVLCIPCFYFAGVKFSALKHQLAMFKMDIWGDMEKLPEGDIKNKKWYQDQFKKGPEPAEPTNLSVSVDWQTLRQERKIKVAQLKKQNLELKELRPLMRQRLMRFGRHKHGVAVDENDKVQRKTQADAKFPETFEYDESLISKGKENYSVSIVRMKTDIYK